MSRTSFERLPDDARVWVFGASQPLAADDRVALLSEVDRFLEGWKAHGTPLTAARDFRHDRFLLIGVDERTAPPSGCSIDAMVHVLRDLEERLDVTLVDNSTVWFVGESGVEQATRKEFSSLAESGNVGIDTVVFDNSITRLDDVRRGRWETPAGDTWFRRAFFAKPGSTTPGVA